MSDDSVIHLINGSFIPVALERLKYRDAHDETGEFYRALRKQADHAQGLWLATWDSHLLKYTGFYTADHSNWAGVVRADLQAGLDQFGTVTPRRVAPTDPFPYRGTGFRPDGSVQLAVSDKPLPAKDLARLPRQGGKVWTDSIILSAVDWSSLAPSNARAASQWTVPEAVARQFFPILSAFTTIFREPSEVTDVQLTGRVASVQSGIAYLVYAGHLVGSHQNTPDRNDPAGLDVATSMKLISGVGSYDIGTRQMLSLTLVWQGTTKSYRPPDDGRPGMAIGTVVEWRHGDAKAVERLEAEAIGAKPKIGLADSKASHAKPKIGIDNSTPEEALKTFLLALAARDKEILHAVTVPDPGWELLLKGPIAPPELLARIKAKLEEEPIKRLNAGDPVKMPDGEIRQIQPDDVREGRVVLWPQGLPFPTRLEKIDGRWRVFAGPYIALGRRPADAKGKPVQTNPPRNARR